LSCQAPGCWVIEKNLSGAERTDQRAEMEAFAGVDANIRYFAQLAFSQAFLYTQSKK
jgi:hypothetical protein